MKKILFVIALPLEIQIIKKNISEIKFENAEINFLISGVGVLNTVFSLQKYLLENSVDLVVNIGVCGILQNISNKEIFQVSRIKNISDEKEAICPIYEEIFSLESILCSGKIVTEKLENFEEKFVDMESFGIDFVCTKMQIPYFILKKPFDEVSKYSLKVSKEDLQKKLEEIDYKYLCEKLDKFAKKLPEKIDLEFYKNYFRFTFTEFENFKKLYKKFEILGKDFDKFFEENKNLNKKEFLKKLEN